MEESFDLGIRFGILKDNRMVARKLAKNHRVSCASSEYLKKISAPSKPEDLKGHRCITMIRQGERFTEWYFNIKGNKQTIHVNSALSSNDGAQIRQWALAGYGIALKSIWDIKSDLESKKLVTLLDKYTQDFESDGTDGGADLNVVYFSRDYLPERTRSFIELLLDHFSDWE